MAVQEAVEFAEADGNTLVVIAGDHETGGMSVGGYDEYESKPEILHDVTATGNTMAEELNDDRSNAAEVLEEYANIDISEEEAARIQSSEEPALEINTVISEHAYVGWTSDAHTGTDVPLYAFGPGSEEFNGLLDNTDLPTRMT
ncbi:alkaline phosphatase [Alteribacillus sp. YIM 98480]|uniref:alkaline phosphatase n=1 Tax=Alteribacillus sp. YIM 98480 TaxID=2606599 RepID=UPI0021035D22|nr:alkaline phosphatase [Alteribacillus sp. YIM 98480]